MDGGHNSVTATIICPMPRFISTRIENCIFTFPQITGRSLSPCQDIYVSVCTGTTYVSLEMETGKPYQEFQRHKKKYPPGQARKKGRGRGNNKEDRGHGSGNSHGERD